MRTESDGSIKSRVEVGGPKREEVASWTLVKTHTARQDRYEPNRMKVGQKNKHERRVEV